ESAWKHLVKSEDQLVLLFTPPFDISNQDPGYIKGYPPGVRENGGQYTHAALWLAIAFARQGNGERAVDLLSMLNPINHTTNPEQVERYRVEPYVVAADVYRLAGRVGQGGWTWYTGSAGWMYRAWIEEVLGLKVSSEQMVIDPVIPSEWDGFKIRYRYGQALYEITVENPEGVERGVVKVEIDGREIEDHSIPLEDRSTKHNVRVQMGKVEDPAN
ncbi:MAG: glycosyl hydrolase family 65 protein, partial [Anaerolineales bacterium]